MVFGSLCQKSNYHLHLSAQVCVVQPVVSRKVYEVQSDTNKQLMMSHYSDDYRVHVQL